MADEAPPLATPQAHIPLSGARPATTGLCGKGQRGPRWGHLIVEIQGRKKMVECEKASRKKQEKAGKKYLI